jgi:hypothetical protein
MKNTFKKGSGCFKCIVCGKQTRDTEGNGKFKMCASCYQREGDLNTYRDGGMTREEFIAAWGVDPAQQRAIRRLIDAARLVVSHGYTQSPAFNYALDDLHDALREAMKTECDRIN